MSAVVAFVLNDARFDSRVIRELQALAAAGHRVLLVARTVDPDAGSSEELELDGVPVIRVPIAAGPRRWIRLARRPRHLAATWLDAARRRPLEAVGVLVVGLAVAAPALVAGPFVLLGVVAGRRIPPVLAAWRGLAPEIAWRVSVLPWARRAAIAAARARPDASVFWAHDLRALPAAIRTRAAVGRGAIVYDAHEIFAEAGEHATRPAWSRRRLAARERSLASRADALVTVNDALASHLGPALGLRRVVVARNCPPRWAPTGPSPLRAAAGVPDGAPIVLYHGGLAPGRGLDVLRAAIDRPGLEAVHLVYLGFGPLRVRVSAIAAASGGRVHLLDPVPPTRLLDWIAGADVVAAPIQPTTLNHRLSSPNKVFEAIAAGVPVIGADLPGIREVLAADPSAVLGALVDPDDPDAVAAGLREVLDLAPEAAAGLRARCLAAAHKRWNWEIESAGLVSLADELGAGAGADAAVTTPPAAPQPPVPQRICFVLPSTGQFDARTLRFASGLAGRGHAVTVVARSGRGVPTTDESTPGVRLVRIGRAEGAGPAGPSRAPFRVTGPLRLVLEARRILGVVGRVREQSRAAEALEGPADVVHAMGFLALPVARRIVARTGAKLVYDARDLYAESNNIARLPRPVRAAFAALEGRWARDAARVFTVNESLADHLERRYRVGRPVVVMNGQVAQAPSPDRPVRSDRLRHALGLAPDSRIVLYHGGLMPDRGLEPLIAAAAEPAFGEAHLVVMGSGVMEVRVHAAAEASPARDRIHFLPPVPPDELLDWVASADVGVMPNQPRTLNERLSTPNKLFECLAAGTPVVSSDFAERRRIIVDDPAGPLGRVCDPTDHRAIAAAVGELLALAPEAFAELRARCREASAARYAWSVQVARAIEAYGAVTGRSW